MRVRKPGLAALGLPPVSGFTGRSALVRALIRYFGHPRMRELRRRALHGAGRAPRSRAAVLRWLEAGPLTVQAGRAGALRLDMRHLTMAHAQLGAIAFGDLESGVQEAMVRHLAPGGVFYDIGANVGFFSLLGARLTGPGGMVYAFEPAPASAQAIEANAALNGFQNIVVIPKAVGARSEAGRLQIVDDQSWSKLEAYGPHPGTETVIDVDVVSIDELQRSEALRPPTLIKIDVEGAELAVLEGLREVIDQHHPVIICELHDTHREFVAAVGQLGYRAINLDGALPILQAAPSAHALALPALDPGD